MVSGQWSVTSYCFHQLSSHLQAQIIFHLSFDISHLSFWDKRECLLRLTSNSDRQVAIETSGLEALSMAKNDK